MTNDQFEQLATMMKGLADDFDALKDDVGDLRDEFSGLRIYIDEQLTPIRADLRMVKTEMLSMGKKLANLEGFGVEVIDHSTRIRRVETKLGMATQ